MPYARNDNRKVELPFERSLRTVIRPSERVFFVGTTGSGKSYLADKLLDGVKVRKLIIDIKADVHRPEAAYTDNVNEIPKLFDKHRTVVYQPEMPYKWEEIDRAFQTAYEMGNVTVYNDERGGWQRPFDIELLPSEAHAIMRGRFRNVGVWSGSQRPSRIPVSVLSEANHIFAFLTRTKADRVKLGAVMGDKVDRSGLIPMRWFWYIGPGMGEATLHPPVNVIRKVHK